MVEPSQDLGAFFSFAKRVTRHADGGQALGLLIGDGGFLEIDGLRGTDDFVPHLVA